MPDDRRTDNARLDSIETILIQQTGQLSTVNNTLLKLVEVETNQKHFAEDVAELKANYRELDERVRTVATVESGQKGGTDMAKQVFIVLITVATTALITLIFSGDTGV